MVKNQPSSTSARNFCIARIADFGLFWPRLASVFAWGNFFLCGEILATFRDQSAMLGEHLSQKITLAHPYYPKFWAKTCPGGSKGTKSTLWPIIFLDGVPLPSEDILVLFKYILACTGFKRSRTENRIESPSCLPLSAISHTSNSPCWLRWPLISPREVRSIRLSS